MANGLRLKRREQLGPRRKVRVGALDDFRSDNLIKGRGFAHRRLGESPVEPSGELSVEFFEVPVQTVRSAVPMALDNGRRSPKKLLRAVVARLFGRKL